MEANSSQSIVPIRKDRTELASLQPHQVDSQPAGWTKIQWWLSVADLALNRWSMGSEDQQKAA
jgi:hypothetical protein